MPATRVGFIGAGQMAQALATGWVQAGLITPAQLAATDPSPAAIQAIQQRVPGIRIVPENAALIGSCEIVVVAVKPQMIASVLGAFPAGGSKPTMVSIVAGWTLAKLQQLFAAPWIRVMPNTPCLVGESASAFAVDANVSPAHQELIKQLLSGVGRAWELPERLLDAVTGLSGSGPAYVMLMIEALSDGGVRMGLPRDVATALAAQTLRGAATMVLQTGEHPASLKDRVTSPAGTTIEGLTEIERHGVRGALIEAVTAATRRARELSAGG